MAHASTTILGLIELGFNLFELKLVITELGLNLFKLKFVFVVKIHFGVVRVVIIFWCVFGRCWEGKEEDRCQTAVYTKQSSHVLDHSVASQFVQQKEFNLKNPSAYHYDILLLGFMVQGQRLVDSLVCHEEDTLWVKWINVEKLKGRSVWEVPIERNSSVGWNNILKLREKVRMHIGYKVGNGKTTSAWYDRWCDEGPLSEFINAREMYNARFKSDCTVDSLIKDGNWCWPMEWLIKFPNMNNIQIPTLINDVKDKVVWITNNGHRT
ncbi:reverse transcriptase zinc-binding domain-containing protein [Artemisia annua]|uniref:Reverse transcriptase zinc-binding domain-containing protein n=1 Tax=Artemisia annua TaxID=35608 RepID=A0A2U1Q310_ARTAN|nr:reverse transcriptase zinc-binding domain-containing protein [Artemisia annua]